MKTEICDADLTDFPVDPTTGQVLGIDARLFLVVAPILAAVSWAAFNIGRAAVGQLQLMLKRSRA